MFQIYICFLEFLLLVAMLLVFWHYEWFDQFNKWIIWLTLSALEAIGAILALVALAVMLAVKHWGWSIIFENIVLIFAVATAFTVRRANADAGGSVKGKVLGWLNDPLPFPPPDRDEWRMP